MLLIAISIAFASAVKIVALDGIFSLFSGIFGLNDIDADDVDLSSFEPSVKMRSYSI